METGFTFEALSISIVRSVASWDGWLTNYQNGTPPTPP